jgi:hypothetical protein
MTVPLKRWLQEQDVEVPNKGSWSRRVATAIDPDPEEPTHGSWDRRAVVRAGVEEDLGTGSWRARLKNAIRQGLLTLGTSEPDEPIFDPGEDYDPEDGVQLVGVSNFWRTSSVGTPKGPQRPANVEEGTLLLMVESVRADATTTAPEGWTLLRRAQTGTTGLHSRMSFWSKIATASEPERYELDGMPGVWAGAVLALDNHAGTGTNSASLSLTAPTVEGTAGGLLVGLFAGREVTYGTNPLPSGMTEVARLFDGSAVGASLIVGWEPLAATGATGSRTLTPSSNWGRDVASLVPVDPAT